MKDKEEYLQEVETRFAQMFKASRDDHKAIPLERHRLEGFMQAGKFLGLATNDELKSLMDRIHIDIFGNTIEQRQAGQATSWIPESIDYNHYEHPAYERGGH
jgi:hypothetical protein